MSERPFPGFPRRASFTPIPDQFFTAILPRIDSMDELKLTLHIFWTIYHKKGYPRFVTLNELLGDKIIMGGMDGDALCHALDGAVERGTLLNIPLEDGEIYLLANDEGKRAKAGIEQGELLPLRVAVEPYHRVEERPNIFSLYEDNIGLLTPIVAEDLMEVERLYPASWIEEAFREAVSLNKRSIRYIQRILERWAREGRDHGEAGGHPEEDKYIKGRYGRIVRR